MKTYAQSLTVSGKYGPCVVSLATPYGRYRAACIALAHVAEFARVRALASRQFILANQFGAIASWGRYPTGCFHLSEQVAKMQWLRAQVSS